MLNVFARLIIPAVCAVLLSACVTTETGGVGVRKDEAKAYDLKVQLARKYVRDGNWEAAKRHLKSALDMDDSSPEIHEAMALVFQNTGEIDRAETHYKRAISIDGSISRIRNNYGAFLYTQERYSEAAEEFERVVTDVLYERRALAYGNLGRCYMRTQEYVKAEQALKRAHLMARHNKLIMLELAEAYYQLGEYAKSQRFYSDFRQLTKQQPQPAKALWLGIRLADKFGNANDKSSYSLALKSLYPSSREYLEYKRIYGSDG